MVKRSRSPSACAFATCGTCLAAICAGNKGILVRVPGTYAKQETLTEEQFQFLKNEGNREGAPTSEQLISAFENKVDEALAYFKTIPENTLTDERFVGRKKLPTTLIGLLFHAAEHSQRHVGQLLVTVSVLKDQ